MTNREVIDLNNAVKGLMVKGLGSSALYRIIDVKCKLNEGIEQIGKRQKAIYDETKPEDFVEGNELPKQDEARWNVEMNKAIGEYLEAKSETRITPAINKEEFSKLLKANDELKLEEIAVISRYLLEPEKDLPN